MSCAAHPFSPRDPILWRCVSCKPKRAGYSEGMTPETRSSDDERAWPLTKDSYVKEMAVKALLVLSITAVLTVWIWREVG